MRGATLGKLVEDTVQRISIHAPRAGSDGCTVYYQKRTQGISIHAPRAGSDLLLRYHLRLNQYFNPRSPCGERQPNTALRICCNIFQSTLPVRGATPSSISFWSAALFQSTLPVRGATEQTARTVEAVFSFQSTLPVRGATISYCCNLHNLGYFNPRSPCGERPVPCLP